MLRNNHPLAHRRLKGTVDDLLQNCDIYVGLSASLRSGGGVGKTKLDEYRRESCKTHVVSTVVHGSSSSSSSEYLSPADPGGGNLAMAPHPVCQWDLAPQPSKILPHKNGTHPSFCLFCLLSTSFNFRTH